MRKNQEQLNLCERTEKYEILREEITYEFKTVKIKSCNGTIVTCKIPTHTYENQTELSEQVCKAMIKLAYPDTDLSKVTYMKVEF